MRIVFVIWSKKNSFSHFFSINFAFSFFFCFATTDWHVFLCFKLKTLVKSVFWVQLLEVTSVFWSYRPVSKTHVLGRNCYLSSLLIPHSQPWCNARAFHFSYAVGLAALFRPSYPHKMSASVHCMLVNAFQCYHKIKILSSWSAIGILTPESLNGWKGDYLAGRCGIFYDAVCIGLPDYRITGLSDNRIIGLPDYRITGSNAEWYDSWIMSGKGFYRCLS